MDRFSKICFCVTRLAWLSVAAVIVTHLAIAQTATPTEEGPIDKLNLQPDVAKQFVQMTFTGCPGRDSVFWETYGDPSSPFQCPRTDDFFHQPTRTCHVVVEYKDMHFAMKEEPLSAADKANGIQWKGFLTDSWTISRIRWIANNSWGPWGPWADTGNGRPNDMVQFIKTNGQWSVGVTVGGQLMTALPIGFNNDIMVKPPRKVPSCADAMNDVAHPEVSLRPAQPTYSAAPNSQPPPTPPANWNAPVISADVAMGMLLQKSDPVYPPIAKAAHVSGTVVIKVAVSKEGAVTGLHVISGPAMLQQAAMDAVKKWSFRPYIVNTAPADFQTTVSSTFPPGN